MSYTTATASVGVDFVVAGNNTGDALGDTFNLVENITGSGHNDVLSGDDNANTIHGMNGNDTLRGRGGADVLIGGGGMAQVYRAEHETIGRAMAIKVLVRELAAGPGASILCGRFEGIDERLFEARPIVPVSVGDYVLSGGETAAFVLLDACVRLLPGVMGAATSGEEESFEGGLLEYPHYTRPFEWEGRTIPEVLRSGDHARIAAWRRAKAEEQTRLRRPDLIARRGDARRPPPSGARRDDEGKKR